VVGGDTSAEQRVRTLLACEAVVHLVSPQVTAWLAGMAYRGALQWQQAAFHSAHLSAMAVVFVTTSDPQQQAWIAALARQQHCLVHVTDNPALCDFFMPAVVRRGHLTLAISTEGQAPAFAAWLRKQLERLLDHRLGDVVARYARLRPALRQRYPDLRTRAQAWERLLTEDPPLEFDTASLEASACRTRHTTSGV
jgi:siroheme synthase-like protein